MPETIDVRLVFDFKGRRHDLRSRIDLAPYLRRGAEPPDLHQILARDNAIDPYSYEYESLQMETPEIVAAQGLAREHLHQGRLDWPGLSEAYAERQRLEAIGRIAQAQLGVEDLSLRPDLRDALLAAYRAGAAAGEGD